MKVEVVKSSELGTNCWYPKKFTNNCAGCDKYETCKYPDRRRHPAYDTLIEEKKVLAVDIKKVRAKMKAVEEAQELIENHGDDRRTTIEESD